MCVCVDEWESKRAGWVEGVGWGGTSSLHQMKLSAGTLLSQTGTHLPMVSCKVLGETGTKVLKGCVTMRVLRGEPLRVGHRQHGTSCANHSAITFLWKPEALCGHSAGGARTRAATERSVASLCSVSYMELTWSLWWHKSTVNHLLLCWLWKKSREENLQQIQTPDHAMIGTI